MMVRALPAARHARALAVLAFASAVYATALVVVRTAAFVERPDVLAFAVAADLTLLVPLAYWAAIVRPGVAARTSLVPVVVLSILGATLVLPAEHRSFVGLARWAVVPLELVLVGYGVWGARRALRAARALGGAGDVAEALESGFVAALGDRVATRLLAAELATLHYALLARVGAAPATPGGAPPDGELAFTQLGARSGATTWGFGLAIVVETVVLHLWLARSYPIVAWSSTALGAYALLWLAGQHRAVGLRRVALAGDTLALRAGLRLTARVPVGAVASVEEVSWRTVPAPARGYLDAAQPAEPNVVLTFAEPTAVTGPFGLRRTVTRVGLRLDDAAGFVAALRRRQGRAG